MTALIRCVVCRLGLFEHEADDGKPACESCQKAAVRRIAWLMSLGTMGTTRRG